jgi:four helix bundle protein
MDEKEFIFPFEKLEVWQLSIELAQEVLNLLATIPNHKHFRLINQMEAAVASISQNISEGKGRQYKKEFVQFLYISEGSLFEVITLTEIFKRIGLFNNTEAQEIRKHCEIIDRKLHGLINSLRNRYES